MWERREASSACLEVCAEPGVTAGLSPAAGQAPVEGAVDVIRVDPREMWSSLQLREVLLAGGDRSSMEGNREQGRGSSEPPRTQAPNSSAQEDTGPGTLW